MDFYENIEKIIKNQGSLGLDALMRHYKMTCNIFKVEKDVYTKVHGKKTGRYQNVPKTIRCIIVGDDFFPVSLSATGAFQEGWLYTLSDIPEPGDKVEIRRGDSKSYHYTIDSKQDIGMTQSVFYKYKLSAL